MENVFLKAIASVVLPAQILDYFTIVGVEQTKTEIHISLDERMNKELSDDMEKSEYAVTSLKLNEMPKTN